MKFQFGLISSNPKAASSTNPHIQSILPEKLESEPPLYPNRCLFTEAFGFEGDLNGLKLFVLCIR